MSSSRLRASLSTHMLAFAANHRGSMAVIYSLVLIPILACFSLAMNYGIAYEERVALQAIVDAAALAGASASSSDTDAARKARAQAWIDTQIALRKMPQTTSTIAVANGTVVVSASTTYKPMMSMIYDGTWTVSVNATAMIATAIIRRALDVVFCIDATGSMQTTLNAVKAKANSFSDDLNTALKARGLDSFDYTRIRAVFYRDYYYDDGLTLFFTKNPLPMVKSNFYSMPSQKSSLTSFLGTEVAKGGGDEPESAYECINEGMSSPWMKVGDTIPGTSYKVEKVYPAIILWTDANALPPPDTWGMAMPLYPTTMPTTESAFTAKWNTASVINQENRMFVMFGPCTNTSWALGRSLTGFMCGGTLNDGNTNMINKIADAMVVRYKNLNTRLTH